MRLKLLSPFRTDISFVSEFPNRKPQAYIQFWKKAEQEQSSFLDIICSICDSAAKSAPTFRLPHLTHHSPYNRYKTLESNSLERPLHLLEIEYSDLPAMVNVTGEDAMIQFLASRVSGLVCRTFDFGISLLEVDVELGDTLDEIPEDEIKDYLRKLQEAGIKLGGVIAKSLADKVLRRVFDQLDELQGPGHPIIEPSAETPEKPFHGMVLWVTRTLIFKTEAEGNRASIIEFWLKDSGDFSSEEGKEQLQKVLNNSSAFKMQWLNYLFREKAYPDVPPRTGAADELATPFCDAWEAMIYSQFYYAAMEVVDLNLTEILSKALAQKQELKLNDLKAILERNLRDANLLLVQFHDNAKYYKRTVKAEMDKILQHWEFETVLVGPVEKKTHLCQERLSILLQKQANRSAIFTDMILMGIGITAIFAFFKDLAEYGRSLAFDVNMHSYDINSWNIIDWLARQPTDMILFLSATLSILLVLVYHHFRKRQTV